MIGVRRMYGATTSSAAARIAGRSMPVSTPSRSKTAVRTSVGELPAPAPSARGRAVDLAGARPVGEDGVRHAHRQVVVAVVADLRLVAHLGEDRLDARDRVVEDQRPGRVDDVGALAAGVDHDPCLPRQLVGRGHVAEHEEADGLHAELARGAEVLDRDVGLGAVRRDAHDLHPGGRGALEILDGADARHEQGGDARARGLVGGGGDERELVRGREAVVERRAAEPVAVGDLDDRHAGVVERADGVAHLALGELVRHRVAAVAQRRVGDADVRRHAALPSRASARRSPDRARRRGHDVQVAGVRRQEVPGALRR